MVSLLLTYEDITVYFLSTCVDIVVYLYFLFTYVDIMVSFFVKECGYHVIVSLFLVLAFSMLASPWKRFVTARHPCVWTLASLGNLSSASSTSWQQSCEVHRITNQSNQLPLLTDHEVVVHVADDVMILRFVPISSSHPRWSHR